MKANIKLLVLVAVLPYIYGCGGAGTGSLLGFLFGSSGVSDLALLGSIGSGFSGAGISDGGAALATLHQPEPASMLLLGSGLGAAAYFKSKTSRCEKK